MIATSRLRLSAGLGLAVICCTAAGFGTWTFARARAAERAVIESETKQFTLRAGIAALERQVAESEARNAAIRRDNATLADALEKARVSARVALSPKPTRSEAEARIAQARELALHGDPDNALKELLWCWDHALAALPHGGRTARASMLTSALAKLAERHAPAREELLRRLQSLRDRLLAGRDEDDAVSNFASFARAAQQPDALVSLYDQLPADSRLRQSLGVYAFRQLVEQRRYRDAAQNHSYASMSSAVERLLDTRSSAARSHTVQTVATNIEVLAGAGELERARSLAERLLKYEPTSEARALVQQHLARAGHPTLLELQNR